jgi:hypothetical protein
MRRRILAGHEAAEIDGMGSRRRLGDSNIALCFGAGIVTLSLAARVQRGVSENPARKGQGI